VPLRRVRGVVSGLLHAPAGSWTAAGTSGPLRRPPSPGIGAYRTAVTVPIGNDGVAFPVTFLGSGSQAGVLNPGTFQTLATAQVNPAGGLMTFTWSVTLSGTLGANDINNFQLALANAGLPFGGFLAQSVNTDVAGTYVQTSVTVNVPAGAGPLELQVKGNTPTAGAVYGGSIAGPAFATAYAGPSGVGTLWSPAQCSLYTSLGPSDPSSAAVYVGPAVLPQYLVAPSQFGGGSQVALGGVQLAPGWFVWVQWSGGVGGTTGYLNVTGSKQALVV
jgi:hypothetical protein